MEQLDAGQLYKPVANQIVTALSDVDIHAYTDKGQRAIIANLRRLVTDVRLDIRDIDMAETRPEADKYARAALKRLEQLHKNVLAASEFNVFNPVDVAQISAQIEQIVVLLKH